MDENFQNHFPVWLAEIDPQIGDKIKSVVNENSISESEVKNLLEEKIKGSFFSKKDVDVKNMQMSIDNSFAINVKQKRHFETRKVERKVVPYDPDKFSKVGFEDELEDLWKQYLIDKFTKKELQWVRGGSAEILPCSTCNSSGKITCPKCKGKGEYWEKCSKCSGKGIISSKCPNCNGRGKVTQGQVTVGGAKRVGPGIGYSSREEQCVRCNASGYLSERCNKCSGQGQILVTCNKCGGKGILTCPTCLGFCQLYSCETITAKCIPSEQEFMISKFEKVKTSWFKGDEGEYIETEDNINIGDYGKAAPSDGRVLLEGYNLKIIPVSRITMKNDKKDNTIFFFGKDKNIIGATTSYLDYTKILLCVVLPFIVLIGILYFFLFR